MVRDGYFRNEKNTCVMTSASVPGNMHCRTVFLGIVEEIAVARYTRTHGA